MFIRLSLHTGCHWRYRLLFSLPLSATKENEMSCCSLQQQQQNIKNPKLSERACLPISTVLVINKVLCPIIKVQVMSNYVDHELIIFKIQAIIINIHHSFHCILELINLIKTFNWQESVYATFLKNHN